MTDRYEDKAVRELKLAAEHYGTRGLVKQAAAMEYAASYLAAIALGKSSRDERNPDDGAAHCPRCHPAEVAS